MKSIAFLYINNEINIWKKDKENNLINDSINNNKINLTKEGINLTKEVKDM